MSTKIYYAWRFRKKHLFDFLSQVNTYQNERFRVVKAELLTRIVYLCIDSKEKWQKFIDLHKKNKERRYWPFCPEMWLNFKVHNDGWVYFAIFGDDTQMAHFRKWFESFEYIQYYGYWNNTDQPDGMSDGQWKRRGQKWNELLGSDFKFSCFLSIQIIKDILDDWDLPLFLTMGHRFDKYLDSKNIPIECERYGMDYEAIKAKFEEYAQKENPEDIEVEEGDVFAALDLRETIKSEK